MKGKEGKGKRKEGHGRMNGGINGRKQRNGKEGWKIKRKKREGGTERKERGKE